jgi:hypothetical protein
VAPPGRSAGGRRIFALRWPPVPALELRSAAPAPAARGTAGGPRDPSPTRSSARSSARAAAAQDPQRFRSALRESGDPSRGLRSRSRITSDPFRTRGSGRQSHTKQACPRPWNSVADRAAAPNGAARSAAERKGPPGGPEPRANRDHWCAALHLPALHLPALHLPALHLPALHLGHPGEGPRRRSRGGWLADSVRTRQPIDC